jgi:radical SAM-linked protein
MVRQRVRIRFSKQGNLRWIGHRDLARLLERLFRRAGLRLGMSEGFHPKPRMGFPSALAVGIEGLDEVMELELAETRTADDLLARLNAHALPGLGFRSVEILPPGARKARLRSLTYQLLVPDDRSKEVADRLARLASMSSCPVRRPRKDTVVDVRRNLDAVNLRDGVLEMRLTVSRQIGAGPRDVLSVLGLDDLEQTGVHLTRTRVELES